jgi:hypothetical protein
MVCMFEAVRQANLEVTKQHEYNPRESFSLVELLMGPKKPF